MISIEFDAAFAHLSGPELADVEQGLYELLSYTDKGVEEQNLRTHSNENPQRSVYDIENHKVLTGLLPKVQNYLRRRKVQCELHTDCVIPDPQPADIPSWLYPHQKEAIATWTEETRGIIKAGTGSGKTKLLSYGLRHFPNSKILITVPTVNLLENMHKAIQEAHPQEFIGKLGDGIAEFGRITVAIVNSAVNYANRYPGIFHDIEVLGCDECHRAAAEMYLCLSAHLPNAMYRIGLSATPERHDGKSVLLDGVIAPIMYEASKQITEQAGVTIKPEFYFVPYQHGNTKQIKFKGGHLNKWDEYCYPTLPKEKPNFQEHHRVTIAENMGRNALILEMMRAYTKWPDRTGLGIVFVDLTVHGRLLEAHAKTMGINAFFIEGKTKNRMAVLDRARACEFDFLIATKVLNEGEDIRPLEFCILATHGNSTALVQRVGRCERTSQDTDKKRAIIVAFNDAEWWYHTWRSKNTQENIRTVYRNSKVVEYQDSRQFCKEILRYDAQPVAP